MKMKKEDEEEDKMKTELTVKTHLHDLLIKEGYVATNPMKPNSLYYCNHLRVDFLDTLIQMHLLKPTTSTMVYNKYYTELWGKFFAMCHFMETQADAEFKAQDLNAIYDGQTTEKRH